MPSSILWFKVLLEYQKGFWNYSKIPLGEGEKYTLVQLTLYSPEYLPFTIPGNI